MFDVFYFRLLFYTIMRTWETNTVIVLPLKEIIKRSITNEVQALVDTGGRLTNGISCLSSQIGQCRI